MRTEDGSVVSAGVAAGAATAGVAAAAQLPKGLRSLVMQTFALRGLPVYVPLTVPSVSVAVDCPGERGRPHLGIK